MHWFREAPSGDYRPVRRRVRRGYRIRQCVDEGWNDGTESFGLKYRVIQCRIASLVWNHHFRDIRVGGLSPWAFTAWSRNSRSCQRQRSSRYSSSRRLIAVLIASKGRPWSCCGTRCSPLPIRFHPGKGDAAGTLCDASARNLGNSWRALGVADESHLGRVGAG